MTQSNNRKVTFEGKEAAIFFIKLGINVYKGDILLTNQDVNDSDSSFFYVYENNILDKKSIFKDKIIACFDKEMYTEENLNNMTEKELYDRATKDEEFCMFYTDVWNFLNDLNLSYNDDCLYRLISW